MLPYGSSVPTDAWKSIEAYLQRGGNLLVLGGQPLRVPVTQVGATFVQGRAQDTYSRALDLRHTYEVPVARMLTLHGGRAIPLPQRPRCGQKNSSRWKVVSTGLATWSTPRDCW